MKKKILIVDDEVDFLKITKINLELTGDYEVKTLSDALDIIAVIREFQPDVILMDILMPKMDGVEACNLLNDDEQGSTIPIITLSALDTDEDKLMMYKHGVVDFIIKPIGREELIAKIEKALLYKK